MKQYIKPNIELLEAIPYTLLEGSIFEDDQDVDFCSKKNNDWSFGEENEGFNKWPKAHSVWD